MVEMSPVFIGGTGRSGTSIMAALLNSHKTFCLPSHENKLIVERGGLKDIVDTLSGKADILRRHFAVLNFIIRTNRLRQFGFDDVSLNKEVIELTQKQGIVFHKAFEEIQRKYSSSPGSIHAIGEGFSIEHYNTCIRGFINSILEHMHNEGIVNADGLLKPFLITKIFTRENILNICRQFLRELYSVPLVNNGAERWLDDTPSNMLYIDFLNELFPDMKFIHMVRNPIDVVSSYATQVWFPNDFGLAANYIRPLAKVGICPQVWGYEI